MIKSLSQTFLLTILERQVWLKTAQMVENSQIYDLTNNAKEVRGKAKGKASQGTKVRGKVQALRSSLDLTTQTPLEYTRAHGMKFTKFLFVDATRFPRRN